MSKAFVFKVAIKGLENKINREIELDENSTINDLACAVLASFNSLGYHMYTIKHNGNKYEKSEDDKYLALYGFKNACTIKICDLNLDEDNEIIMDYDLHDHITFVIRFVKEEGKAFEYPIVINGMGSGMIEGVSGSILKDIINDIDEKGFSKYNYTKEYGFNLKYDYRNFDLKQLKSCFKVKFLEIRDNKIV